MFESENIGIKKLFSLVELLTVLCVLTVLASLFIPGMKKVIERARQVECSGKIWVLYSAFREYAEDYYESLPRDRGSYHDFTSIWSVGIYPYLTGRAYASNGIFIKAEDRPHFTCPSYETYNIALNNKFEGNQLGIRTHTYSMNNCVYGLWNNEPIARWQKVEKPSKIHLLSDSHIPHDNGYMSDTIYWSFPWTGNHGPLRHNGGGRVTFFDGSNRWLEYWEDIRNNKELFDALGIY